MKKEECTTDQGVVELHSDNEGGKKEESEKKNRKKTSKRGKKKDGAPEPMDTSNIGGAGKVKLRDDSVFILLLLCSICGRHTNGSPATTPATADAHGAAAAAPGATAAHVRQASSPHHTLQLPVGSPTNPDWSIQLQRPSPDSLTSPSHLWTGPTAGSAVHNWQPQLGAHESETGGGNPAPDDVKETAA